MPRKPEGGITAKPLGDRTHAFHLRFRAYGERERVTLHERRDCPCCGGGWTPATARVELENILARVQAGIWRRQDPARITDTRPQRCPTFHEYASTWLAGKRQGVMGDRPIGDETHGRLLWALRLYLLPFFAKYRVDEIDRDLCLSFKQKLLRDADDTRQALAAGAKLKHRNGRRARPLSPSSMRKVIDTLAQVLDDAVEDDLIATNPARGKRMRIKVPKPNRTFLEQDELAALLDAAGQLDRAGDAPTPTSPTTGTTAAKVAELAAQGLRPTAIAERLGKSKATVSYHLRRLDAPPAEPYLGRRAIAATLGYAGPRVSELCDLRIGQLRLHDADGARFRILDAKTPTGIREVEISPDLVEVLVEHIDQLRRVGRPVDPDVHVFQNTRGDRLTRQRAAELVSEAADAATLAVAKRGQPPLPNVTPHTLRRTYVSIALLASSFDIRWVMAQVGHADSSMTLDVYAQLQQREQREHGPAFDAKIRSARERLLGSPVADNVGEGVASEPRQGKGSECLAAAPSPTTADEALAEWTA